MPLVEARTRGCLVIASDLPVFRELADQGVRLYLVNSEESMAKLVLQHAAGDPAGPMSAFALQDSANQCLKLMAALLAAQQAAARAGPEGGRCRDTRQEVYA